MRTPSKLNLHLQPNSFLDFLGCWQKQAPVTFSPHLFMVQYRCWTWSSQIPCPQPSLECVKNFFQKWDLTDRALGQMIPVHPYKYFGFTRFVRQSPPPSVPIYHQMVICWELCPSLDKAWLSKIHFMTASLIMQPQSWSLTSGLVPYPQYHA